MNEPLMEISKLNKAFGMVVTARDIDIVLQRGVLTSIIGPNGAGKSTLINILTGLLRPDSGRIRFAGRDITDTSIHDRVRLGLCRSFQVANVFPDLTVLENVAIPTMAVHNKTTRLFGRSRSETEVLRETDAVLEKTALIGERDTYAKALSHGDQRLLEVAIALAAKPRLLFLDEPTAGMNPMERVKILETIRRLHESREITFVIVEHDMDIVFSLSERVIVLHRGDIIGDGTPDQIKANAQVREVYLGEEVTE